MMYKNAACFSKLMKDLPYCTGLKGKLLDTGDGKVTKPEANIRK